MKRDMDLVRQILFALEAYEHGLAPNDLVIEGHTKEEIGYHIHLMGQAELLEVSDTFARGCASPQAAARSMTWAGHDFLDAARSDTIWNRAKAKLGKAWDSVSFDILKGLLVKLVGEAVAAGERLV